MHEIRKLKGIKEWKQMVLLLQRARLNCPLDENGIYSLLL